MFSEIPVEGGAPVCGGLCGAGCPLATLTEEDVGKSEVHILMPDAFGP